MKNIKRAILVILFILIATALIWMLLLQMQKKRIEVSNEKYEKYVEESKREETHSNEELIEETESEIPETEKATKFDGELYYVKEGVDKVIIVSNTGYVPSNTYIRNAIEYVAVIDDYDTIGYILMYPTDKEVLIAANGAVYRFYMNNEEVEDYTPAGSTESNSYFKELMKEFENEF